MKLLAKIFKLIRRYKTFFLFIFAAWALFFFGLGTLVGNLFSKAGLEKFPDINQSDSLLIVSPHVDDEVIGTAGIIQEALSKGAKVNVVYLSNGDDNLSAALKEDKTLDITPNDLVKLGETRMNEGVKAAAILGLRRQNLIFLGFPDRGLSSLLVNYYDSNQPYTSAGTKFTYNPYSDSYKQGQLYVGKNVYDDLKEIIETDKPTIIFTTHPLDKHPDHRAAYRFVEKVLADDKQLRPKVFTFLVHYNLFPLEKIYKPDDFLYPPKKLFAQNAWHSFDLSPAQEKNKLNAINQNISQINPIPLQDLLRSFVKRNEIFQEME